MTKSEWRRGVARPGMKPRRAGARARVELCVIAAVLTGLSFGDRGAVTIAGATLRAQTSALGFAYVVSPSRNEMVPVDLGTGTPGRPIAVGADPLAIAVTPDGSTGYVIDYGSGTVTPINLGTGAPGRPIAVGAEPSAIAMAPNGRTVYVVGHSSEKVLPIAIANNKVGRSISLSTVLHAPAVLNSIAIAPNGRTAYVGDITGGLVVPVDLRSGSPGTPIKLSAGVGAIAITADGKLAYVVNQWHGTVSRVDLENGTVSAPVNVGADGNQIFSIAIDAWDGTAYVAVDTQAPSGKVVPLDLATNVVGKPIETGWGATSVCLAPNGATGYVSDGAFGGVVQFIDLVTHSVDRSIRVGREPFAMALSKSP